MITEKDRHADQMCEIRRIRFTLERIEKYLGYMAIKAKEEKEDVGIVVFTPEHSICKAKGDYVCSWCDGTDHHLVTFNNGKSFVRCAACQNYHSRID